MRTPLISLMALLSACTEDETPSNRAPTIEITSHLNGEPVQDGYPILFEAVTSDGNHELTDLTVSWTVAEQELCETAAPDEEGYSSCEATLGVEDSEIVAMVTDPAGAMAWETLQLNMVETETPTANVTAPDGESTYYSNFEITLEGTVADGEDELIELVVWWESSVDGPLDLDTTLDENGSLSDATLLTAGEHTLTLWVEDLTGKTGSDSVTIDIPGDATAPSCEITSPEDGLAVGYTEDLNLTGVVSDEDIPIEDLTVDFLSDLDGDLGTVSVNINTGDVTLVEDSLILGEHEISLVVSDEVGLECTDTVSILVGHLPEIEYSLPDADSVVNYGDAVTLEVEVSDEDSELSELSVVFTSDIDGELGTVIPEEDGTASLELESLSVGNQDITAVLTDAHGLTAEDILQFVINDLPSSPEIELGPDPATTVDDLVVTITTDAEDEEGDEITYTYAWALDGKTSTASESDTLSAESTAKNQTWTVTVTAADAWGEGESVEASLTISNTPPEMTSPVVVLAPEEAATDDELTCTYEEGSDVDDDPLTYTISWEIDGSVVSGQSESTLDGEHFSKGETVTCTVTISDDEVDGDSVTSNTATIINTTPTISDLSIVPEEAYAEDVLSCVWESFEDADDDTDATEIEWSVGRTNHGSDPTLEGVFVFDDDVTCEATAHDGEESGNNLEVTITILNTVPIIDSVSISPDPATVYDALTCSWDGFYDPDGQDDDSSLVWTLDGVELGVDATLAGGYVKGDEVICTVTPYDDEDEGTPMSTSIVIGNTAPEMTSVEISPSDPQTNDTLSLSVDGWDLDDDSLSYDVLWYVNGSPISATGTELDGQIWFDKDDEVMASVTPDDGEATGDPMDSETLTILNTEPAAPEVEISPDPAVDDDDLICSVSTDSTDDDSDSVSYTFSWTQDGVPYSGATSTTETDDTVPSSDTSSGELWLCTVTPSDGDEDGPAGTAQRAIDMGCLDLGGDGSDGDLTVSAGSSETLQMVATSLLSDAEAGAVEIEVGDPSLFTSGDEILILTMVGEAADCDSSAAGTWELGYVYSTTSTSLELLEAIAYTYDSDTSTTQVIRVPKYETVDLGSGATLTANAWDGETGGVLIMRAETIVLDSGAVIHMDAAGYLGADSGGDAAQGPVGFEDLGGGTGGNGGDGCNGCTGTAGEDGVDGGGGGGSAGGVVTQASGGTCGGGGGAGAGQGGPSSGGLGSGEGGDGAASGGAVRAAGGGGGACAYEVPSVCSDWGMERLLMGAGASAGAAGGCAGESLVFGEGGSADGGSTCGSDGASGEAGGGIVMLMATEITGASGAVLRANGGEGGLGGDGASGDTVGTTVAAGNAGGGAGSGGVGGTGGTVLISAETWGSDADLIEADASGGEGGIGGWGGDGSCAFGSTDVASGGEGGGAPGGDGTTASGSNCSGGGGGGADGEAGDHGIIFVPYESTSTATFLYVADPAEARRLWGDEECADW